MYFYNIYLNIITMCKKSQKQEEATTTPPYKHCLNCGSELQGPYCHTCGQQAVDPRPSVKSFVMEYIQSCLPTGTPHKRISGWKDCLVCAPTQTEYVHPLCAHQLLLVLLGTREVK